MKKRVLMCPPAHFDVAYELNTNRWMNKNVRPDKVLANEQWARLAAALSEYSELLLITPERGLPDMTFAANAGIVCGYRFITSHFFHKERQPESRHYKAFFEKRGHKVLEVPYADAFFEGQGDAVWLGHDKLLIGYGVRTNLTGAFMVEDLIRNKCYSSETRVMHLAMRPVEQYKAGEYIFYHLDTCLLYLPHVKTFLAYERAFAYGVMKALRVWGKIILVTKEEAEQFICNSVVIDRETIFMPWVNPRIRGILQKLGYKNIKTFPMSEFIKSGGAVKCLVLETGP